MCPLDLLLDFVLLPKKKWRFHARPLNRPCGTVGEKASVHLCFGGAKPNRNAWSPGRRDHSRATRTLEDVNDRSMADTAGAQ